MRFNSRFIIQWLKVATVLFLLVGVVVADGSHLMAHTDMRLSQQSTEIATSAANDEPVERLIDIGGYKLYLKCVGQGSPTVILDAGADDSTATWGKVQPEVGQFTEVCAYNRAGIGKSDPRPQKEPATFAQVVNELHILLDNAQIKPPYILAGHSLGGLIARYYVTRYPDQIAGLVLVDGTPPEIPAQLPRLLDYGSMRVDPSVLKLFDQAGPFPNIPLIVLEHTPNDKEWQTLQAQQAKLSPQGLLIVADHSGHYIQMDQPELVINAIRHVVETVKNAPDAPSLTPFWTPIPTYTATATLPSSPTPDAGQAQCLPAAPANASDMKGVVTEFAIPTAKSAPYGIAQGPDGAVWFGEGHGKNLGRITADGKITEFAIPGASADDQHFLGTNPDGTLWFTETDVNKIGFATMDGKITEFTVPGKGTDEQGDSGTNYITTYPAAFVAGPDKAMYFTEMDAAQIGKITPDGKFTEYPTPTPNSGPLGMTLGPDGALWIVERSANQIARMTLDGKFTEYSIPTPKALALRIAVGVDNALWFSEAVGNKIGRITLEGKFAEFAAPRCASPIGITLGPDSAIWFTEGNANRIGRITNDGQITEYPIPTANSVPFSIVSGSDNAIWFTEMVGNKIGRIQVK